nr:MAG: DNA pilot protein [Microvirus sp.]
MDPVTAMAIYGGGAGLSALGSWLGGQSQADAIKEANRANERLTRESWQRDDTAVQRRTQDLIKAGLNPALAAGSAASTSAPLPMQAAANTGPAAALQSAGQSVSAWPTVEQALKRSAAQTLQQQAAAELTHQQARITKMDADDIQAGNDPRDKTPINQLLKLLPRLVKNLSPGGAIREAATTAYGAAQEMVHGNPEIRAKADALAAEANRLMRGNPTKAQYERAKRLNAESERLLQGGFRK